MLRSIRAMQRDAFLARIRDALGPAEERDVPRPDAPSPVTAPDPAVLADLFARELEAVGGEVRRASSGHEVRDTIVEILRTRGVRRIVRERAALLEELDLDEALTEAGLEVLEVDSPNDLDVAFSADAGLTAADWGIAETGTLALVAAPGRPRSVSLLPPLHVAVLDACRLVPELGTLVAALSERGTPPSALTLVTGPSRTGDIELTLTVGVHGPGELVCVLVSG